MKSEKLRALLAGRAQRILFVGKPEWAPEIQRGFSRLPHQVEFGPVAEDSFERYDLVVPLSLCALDDVRRFSSGHKIAFPLPPEESVRLCNDKLAFNQALVAAGFGAYIPKFAQGPALKPPYILKKRIGSWGLDCFLILNEDDRRAHLNRIGDPEFFCQEFIPGPTEFATHILFLGGKIMKALNVRYTFGKDTPIKGQEAVVLQGVHRCSHLDLFTEILRLIRYEGLCCVNYKISNGELYLLEINPRFGGSLAPYFFSFIRHLH